MGTAFTRTKTSPASWDAFSDVDASVDAVLAELAAMAADGTGSTRSGSRPPLTGAALRKAIMAIWQRQRMKDCMPIYRSWRQV
jgi:hypothetical protein